MLTSRFGRIVVPNVTPDAGTGIGGYDDEDFERAMRERIRPDGTPIYPAMPYEHYTKMRDADIADLWAYIKTVDPVRNEVADNALPFPFNVRAGIEAWKTA